MRLLFALLLGTCLLPAAAHAETFTTLDLRQGQTNATWEAFLGLTVSRQRDGLLLSTGTETGILLTNIRLGDAADPRTGYDGFPSVVALVTDASATQDVYVAWHRITDPEGSLARQSVRIDAGTDMITYGLLTLSPAWNPPVDQVALMLPPQTTLLLREMTFVRWSAAERLWNAFLSFFSMQEYRLHVINFVWGPRLAWNPVERDLLWQSSPPLGISVTYALNTALLFGIVLLAFLLARNAALTRRERSIRLLHRTTILLLTAWIALDARMGTELIRWFGHDFATYIAAPAGAKSLRNFDQFHEFAMFTAPLVQDRSSYVFFSPRAYPDVPQMRYYTYPAVPGQDIEDDTWVIYDRPDITVTDGRLVIDGRAVTESGELVGRFDDSSFVFRVSP